MNVFVRNSQLRKERIEMFDNMIDPPIIMPDGEWPEKLCKKERIIPLWPFEKEKANV